MNKDIDMKLLNRRLALISTVTGLTLIAASSAAYAGSDKVLTKKIAVDNIKEFVIDAHVGTVKLSASNDNQFHIYVKVSEKDGWAMFKSNPEDAKLKIDNTGDKLTVSLNDDDFGEEWRIEVPQMDKIDADLGVGEMTIKGLQANLSVDVGVGEVSVYSMADSYATVKAESGVGAANVHSDSGKTNQNRSMVSEAVSWVGKGDYAISVEVGVGDASIKLN